MIKKELTILSLLIGLTLLFSCGNDKNIYLTFSRAECSINLPKSLEIFKVFERYNDRYYYVISDSAMMGQRIPSNGHIFKNARKAYIWLGAISSDSIVPSYSSRPLRFNLDCLSIANVNNWNEYNRGPLNCDSSSFFLRQLSPKYFLVFESKDLSLLQDLEDIEIKLLNEGQDMQQASSE